jgi:hypothetical protein
LGLRLSGGQIGNVRYRAQGFFLAGNDLTPLDLRVRRSCLDVAKSATVIVISPPHIAVIYIIADYRHERRRQRELSGLS